MVLHESGEDYLEAILVLRQQKGTVRSIDVAQYLGYSKPSVSRAVSILKSNGYLTMERDGRLELTPQGEANAQRVYERHRFLSQWLVKLGVSPEVAAADACRIEHDLSAETFECLKEHVRRGRSTPGPVQQNNGEAVWSTVRWLEEPDDTVL